jgi:hypothetical protein
VFLRNGDVLHLERRGPRIEVQGERVACTRSIASQRAVGKGVFAAERESLSLVEIVEQIPPNDDHDFVSDHEDALAKVLAPEGVAQRPDTQRNVHPALASWRTVVELPEALSSLRFERIVAGHPLLREQIENAEFAFAETLVEVDPSVEAGRGEKSLRGLHGADIR